MDTDNDSLKLFPIPRYFDCGDFNFYYPYGNTPAEDFLENVSPHSVKEPNVLVLGCGDIRSCFYTLWRHFTSGSTCNPSFSPLFSGVHFVLNDHSAAVLARNIIFLHLCLQKPVEIPSEDFKKWLCGLWAIWFSRNLLPAHEQMLDSALRDLLKYATDMTSWTSQDNPLSSLVRFSSDHTLCEICNVWKMWSKHSIDIKAIDDKHARRFTFSTSQNTDIENMIGMAMSMSLSSYERERMEYEIQLCSTGNSFAECVVSDGQYLPPRTLAVNLTMYGISDGKFILHSLLPFRCFYHGFKFSPSQLKLNCNDETLLGKLIVADEKFKQYPLLANSVQQFALWLSDTSTLPSSTHAHHGMQCTTFTFHCSDAIAFCNELQTPASKLRVEKKFDVIYTSNLLDPIYPPNLVLFTVPLLKPNSYLFTTTIKYKTLARTTQEYLENSFGVDNKMLPILFGIRCINHEGNQYKSTVSIRPAPVEVNAVSPEFTPYYVKVLIWEKVSPMVVSSIPPDSILWHNLYSSVSTILSLPPDSLNASSSQTVVKMLQTFLAHVNADDSDGKFWGPLCSLIKCNKDIEHLMNALQTHTMLNGLHLHLTVTSKTCPVCNEIALTKYFGQFCVSVKPLTQFGLVNVYAQIHKSEQHNYYSFSTFDCLASQKHGSSLSLRFIAPLPLCKSGYYVSIVSFGENKPPTTFITGPLKSFLNSSITYSFSTFTAQNRSLNTSFGSVSSHYGNGDTFESIIQLSDIGYDTYSKSKKIHPELLSPTVIKLSCGFHNLELSYPHPINFSTLSLTISRSRRTITIIASRACHKYEEEMAPVFLVNPDKILTLPRLNLHSIVIRGLMGMQISDYEQSLLLRANTSRPPLPDLKNCINMLMQEKKMFFTFVDPSNSLFAMMLIVNRVLDYQLKAPAIDLIYCVTTVKETVRKWAKFSLCDDVLEMSRDTIQLIDKTFLYFSRRTLCSLQTEKLLALQWDVDSCFKRAIVYPLYSDADDIVHNQYKTWTQIKSDSLHQQDVDIVEEQCCSICGKISVELFKCDHCLTIKFCGKCKKQHWTEHTILCEKKSKTKLQSENSNSSTSSDNLRGPGKCGYCLKPSHQLRKCSRCLSVQYCSQDCQKKHWKEHKSICCKQPIPSGEQNSSCSYCNTVSNQLKKCTVCHAAQYCNQDCQKKHWKEHKTICSKQTISSAEKTSLSCSYCNTASNQLKTCTVCRAAQYCDKECQQKHWKEHKTVCFKQTSENASSCSYCNTISSQLKKCTVCHAAQYCDKECQQKHWNDHKLHCKSKQVCTSSLLPQTKSSECTNDIDIRDESQKCSYCSKITMDLKKCSRCHRVHYCNKTCQQKHWHDHKLVCQSKP